MTAVPAPRTCPNCQASVTPGARFCAQCATPVVATPAPPAGGERKQVTILFSDLSGYTALSERLDAEETGALMARVFAHATTVVERYDGRVEKFMGDAVMAVFGVPEAHEDDPIRAARAALELHAAVDEIAAEVEDRLGTRLTMHSGINTGEIVTGALDLNAGRVGIVGDTINVASRLMSEAPAGQIWMGPTTAALVAKAVDSEAVGEVAFKGKSAPLPVSRVTGLGKTERIMRPTRTRFVGRGDELAVLLGAVDEVRAGRSASFGVRAEAGGGKTRLFEEFRQRLPEDARWLEGRAYGYTQRMPYFLLLDLWRRAFGINEDDRPEEVRQKLESGVTALLGPDPDALPIVGQLFDVQFGTTPVDSLSFSIRLVEATRALLGAWASQGPAVLCLQDLHWADSASATLVSGIMAEPDAPVVCIANYRPGFAFDDDRIRSLDLSTLSADHVHEMTHSMLEGGAPDGLDAFIDTRSEGNPFFAEEIVNTLIETGTLSRNGRWTLTGPLEAAGVPSTVQGVLAARIDRLDDDRRRILREASVIGREFLYDLVTRVSGADAPLDDALAGLEAADLIREKSRDEYLEYIFKHALTQEVAYEGLLKTERKTLHRRVGEAIETLLADRLGEYAETLAYHFHRAGDTEKAVRYAIDAGTRAFDRHALDAAVVHFASGYELLDELTRTSVQERLLVELVVEWAEVLLYDLKFAEAKLLLERHWVVARTLDDPDLTTRFRAAMMTPYWSELDFGTAETMAAEAMALAKRHRHVRGEASVLVWDGFSLLSTGRVEQALSSVTRGTALADEHGYPAYVNHWLLGMSQLVAGRFVELESHLGWMDDQDDAGVSRYRPYAACLRCVRDIYLVDPDSAERHGRAGLAVPYEAFEGSYLMGWHAVSLVLLRRYDEAHEVNRAHLEYHSRRPTEFCESSARGLAGGVAAVRGAPGRGMADMLREIALQETAGQRHIVTVFQIFLAETYVRIADMEVMPSVPVLLTNLGFVFRHALPAKHHARRYVDQARQQIAECGLQGLAPWMEFTAARVALLEKRRDEAHRALDACFELRRAAGFPEPSPTIRSFAERLEA